MIIKKYDIELHRLTEADIELVRHHRNSHTIRSKMFHQNTISKEEQVKWFEKINNSFNYYFIIIWKGKKVGLINGTITSLEKQTSTGGVFFWDEKVLQTYIPMCASIIMGDLTFCLLNMKKTTAMVRSDNKVALQFNTKLGYDFVKEEDGKVYMEMLNASYLSSELRMLMKRISKDYNSLGWDNIELSDVEIENKRDVILPEFLCKYLSYQEINA